MKTSQDALSIARMRWSQAEVASLLGVNQRTVARWESPAGSISDRATAKLEALNSTTSSIGTFDFVDLFAGIGGTRLGFESAGGRCVFTSEWNRFAQRTYLENFGSGDHHTFAGDITHVHASTVPDHEVLLAGFPCQPFSIAGVSKKNSLGRPHGFADATQGTLFFDVARIIAEKRPRAFMLENVRGILSHDKGNTIKVIERVLRDELGYTVQVAQFDASAVVPQMRRRVYIVGFDGPSSFALDDVALAGTYPRMSSVLHPQDGSEAVEAPYTVGRRAKVSERYVLSQHLWTYLQNYAAKHRRAGNGFGYGIVGPTDVARTLSARYHKDGAEILVKRGNATPRRLTPRECARLMGFPDTYRIPVSDTQAYRQFGNSVVVPVISAIAREMAPHLDGNLRLAATG